MQCHSLAETPILAGSGSIALIGHPNVGKSALFHQLTGQRVVVSNYPGTTVEVTRGAAHDLSGAALVDTPGVIALPASSDDERVTERVLLQESLRALLQVGDAKNLRRTLLLTCQLAEMGLPLVLALNMSDEAQSLGIKLDHAQLAQFFGIQVVATVAVKGQGVKELIAALESTVPVSFRMVYSRPVETVLEQALASDQAGIFGNAPISGRALVLLWLGGDSVAEEWIASRFGAAEYAQLLETRRVLETALGEPIRSRIQFERLERIEQIAEAVTLNAGGERGGLAAWLGRFSTHPVWGWAILAIVLFALYWFVGVFGAGKLVNLLEGKLFGEWLNPLVTGFVQQALPIPWLANLFIGPYGLWTMGVTYAVALILPIVTTFFLAFGMMEDSGYLPRLAALSNRLFQKLGLNGKAVLPMVLGLGCVTMATLTTRVLESKRERLLAILLLALAVPCSAQLGVVMGMLAGISMWAVMIWGGVVLAVMLAVGWLAAQLVPGERTMLLVELPPLRLPQASNVVVKTLARLEWYIREVLPLFLIGSFLMYLLDLSGVLTWLLRASEPLVTGWLGLPPQASAAFLMGFLRRDFGATGLFVMQSHGQLSALQVVVAMVTITLFIPCLASVLMIAKERSPREAVGMLVLIMPLALFIGGLLERVLMLIGWGG